VKRIFILLTLIAGAAVATGTVASAGSPAHAARVAKVELRQTALGKILVNGRGFTLYVFTRDRRNRDACVKISMCTSFWPVLKTSGRPIAGRGVKASLLSTIRLPDGIRQVTYVSRPLYRYSGDASPGQTSYVGLSQFGGHWYAINAAGRVVR